MHILFLTDNFPPEVNAPASRTFEHCREWVKSGHKVTVVTCVPNFPRGKIYNGYRNLPWQTETIDGIRVVRVWSYITANEGFFRRTLDYISFMVSAAMRAPFVRDVELVVGTSPQFFTVCAAYMVSRLKRIPFVFELRDLWPESIRAVGATKNERILGTLEKLELFLYRRAACIIPNTESFKRTLVERGIDGSKIKVVINGVDLERFHPQPKDDELVERLGLEDKFVAGYIGTHGMAHALDTLLLAAKRAQEMPEGARLHFLFLGDGANKRKLIDMATKMRLTNVTFLDSVRKDDVIRYWSLLDASIIHLRKTDLFTTVIPSKLFESMAMTIPVLHGVKGESAKIVEREGVGLPFEPEDSDALLQELIRLENDHGLRTRLREAAQEAAPRYERRSLAHRMMTILEGVLQDFERARAVRRFAR